MHFRAPLALLSLFGHARYVHCFDTLYRRAHSASQIRAELGPQLSAKATIIDADNGDLHLATLRWQEYDNPTFISVVEVATVEDILKTVTYATKNSIPFLAKNGGHGAIKGLEDLKDGIQITLSRLNGVIVHDNNTATVQGGARSYDVKQALWNKKKQTTTGVCECTGFLGPALGGGHGLLQGRYGLAVDNFLAARVLLGNGTLINVSENENQDLWWGLRGAGANFGIVTEVDVKIYDVPEGDIWYYEVWQYDQAILEKVFEQHNKYLDSMPAGAVSFSSFFRDSSLDPSNALVSVGAMYNGPKSAAEPLFAPFRSLGPLATVGDTVSYDKLPTVTGVNLEGPACQYRGLNRVKNGLYLTRYNPTSQREAYELFNATTAAIPAFNGSIVIFDGFSVEGTSKIPVDSTAMPWRKQQILLTPVTEYQPDVALDQAAEQLSMGIRDILQRTSGHSEMRSYINYAFGNETLAELYGSNERVAKLRDLKRTYDPQNVFKFFGPPGGIEV